ncbi:MAG TPA: hypothetical protein VJB59_09750 [Bdellovibrionota bacterium]|nr:hypothetical protein [Bdellovibrionota bacterium]
MAFDMIRRRSADTSGRFGVKLNWGSIFSGAIVTLGVGLMFVLLGNALGLSASNLVRDNVGSGLRAGSWIYNLLTLVAAFYAGGYTSSRACGLDDYSPALFHSISCWALTGLFIVGFGITQSDVFRQIIAGTGPASARWLVLCVSLFGLLASIMGGKSGVSMSEQVPITESERDRDITRRVA